MSLFCDHLKSPNTTEIGVSAGTRENPKNGTFGLKSAILGRALDNGFNYLGHTKYTNAVLCLKHYYYIVFSAKHSFAEIEGCKLKKNRNLPNIGVICQHAKRCLFCSLVFLFSLLFSFFFGKGPKKVVFLQV